MPYSQLDPAAIVRTAERLKTRVQERFPARGLGDVASELVTLAHAETGQAKKLSQPRYLLRFLVTLIIVAAIAGTAYIVWAYGFRLRAATDISVFESVEALINIALLAAAGIFFLTSLETRSKRSAVLKRLHALRSIAHIIDMHQLTKDPTVDLHGGEDTASSPQRDLSGYELVRYLDYCAEMLAITGKLSAVYLEYVKDSVVITAVGEIENLTSDLSRKIWQKISVIEPAVAAIAEADPAPQAEGPADPEAPEPHPIDDLLPPYLR